MSLAMTPEVDIYVLTNDLCIRYRYLFSDAFCYRHRHVFFTFFTLMVMESSFDLIILVLIAIISRRTFLNDEVDKGYFGRPCSHRISFVTR